MTEPVSLERKRDGWAKVRNVGAAVLIWIMVGLIAWVVVSSILGRSTTNADLRYEIRYGNCILTTPIEERSNPGSIEECRRYAAQQVP